MTSLLLPSFTIVQLNVQSLCTGATLNVASTCTAPGSPISVSPTLASLPVMLLTSASLVHNGANVSIVNLACSYPSYLSASPLTSGASWVAIPSSRSLALPPAEWVILQPGLQIHDALLASQPTYLVHAASGQTLAMQSYGGNVGELVLNPIPNSLELSCLGPTMPIVFSFNQPTPSLGFLPQPWWLELTNYSFQAPAWWIPTWYNSWGDCPPWFPQCGGGVGPRPGWKRCNGVYIPRDEPCGAGPGVGWTVCPDGQWVRAGTRCPGPRPFPPGPGPRPMPGEGFQTCPDGSVVRSGTRCPFPGSVLPPMPGPLGPGGLPPVLPPMPGPLGPGGLPPVLPPMPGPLGPGGLPPVLPPMPGPLGPGLSPPPAPGLIGPGGVQRLLGRGGSTQDMFGPGGTQNIFGPGGVQPANPPSPFGPGGIQPISPIDRLGPGGVRPLGPTNPLGPGGVQPFEPERPLVGPGYGYGQKPPSIPGGGIGDSNNLDVQDLGKVPDFFSGRNAGATLGGMGLGTAAAAAAAGQGNLWGPQNPNRQVFPNAAWHSGTVQHGSGMTMRRR